MLGSMRKTAPFLLLCAFCSVTLFGQNVTFYFPQVADANVGDIVFRTTFIFVNTGAATTASLDLFDSDGRPMSLAVGDRAAASQHQIPLARGQSFSGQTPGSQQGVRLGYAKVTAGSGVGGTAVFTRSNSAGVVMYEAGVPATFASTSANFSLFLDSIGVRDTGLAMVNTGASEANIALNLYDKSFNQVATTNVPLAGGKHVPKFIWEFFSAVTAAKEMEGSVTVFGTNLAAVTLRTNDDATKPFPQSVPVLTTFPVVSGRGDQSSVSGSFSVLSGGDVVVALDLRPEKERIMGAIYRFYEGIQLVGESVKSVESRGLMTEVLAVPGSRQKKPAVDRVEVQLVYEGGRIGERFELAR